MTGDGFDLGGTADNDYVLHFIGLCVDMDLMERNRYIRECWLFLLEKIGAVLSATGWQILYWSAYEKIFLRWILDRSPFVIRAGYMSRSRGRHWNRSNNQ